MSIRCRRFPWVANSGNEWGPARGRVYSDASSPPRRGGPVGGVPRSARRADAAAPAASGTKPASWSRPARRKHNREKLAYRPQVGPCPHPPRAAPPIPPSVWRVRSGANCPNANRAQRMTRARRAGTNVLPIEIWLPVFRTGRPTRPRIVGSTGGNSRYALRQERRRPYRLMPCLAPSMPSGRVVFR